LVGVADREYVLGVVVELSFGFVLSIKGWLVGVVDGEYVLKTCWRASLGVKTSVLLMGG
jgi:hypothetical protein